jgi:large-conductance mechanosensitive channel
MKDILRDLLAMFKTIIEILCTFLIIAFIVFGVSAIINNETILMSYHRLTGL